MIEPMTAAEYRAITKGICDVDPIRRTLAAIEEREALLGERVVLTDERDRARKEAAEVRRLSESDASVGALVRRILDHPAATRGHSAFVYTHNGTWATAWTEKGLQLTLSHLDSLLPKEPEVVVKLGGRTWTFGKSPAGNTNVWWRPGDGTATVVASGELELALNALNALGGPRGV